MTFPSRCSLLFRRCAAALAALADGRAVSKSFDVRASGTLGAKRRAEAPGGGMGQPGLLGGCNRGEVAQGCEALECLALELADALAREAQLGADCLQRPGLALEPEAQLEDAPLPLRKRVERLADALLAQRLLRLVEWVGCLAVREEIA